VDSGLWAGGSGGNTLVFFLVQREGWRGGVYTALVESLVQFV